VLPDTRAVLRTFRFRPPERAAGTLWNTTAGIRGCRFTVPCRPLADTAFRPRWASSASRRWSGSFQESMLPAGTDVGAAHGFLADPDGEHRSYIPAVRANRIEADDTSCVRLVTARGTTVTVAATLCAERDAEPYVVVHGTRGRIVLEYRTGRAGGHGGSYAGVGDRPVGPGLVHLGPRERSSPSSPPRHCRGAAVGLPLAG
jgi:hypothetical protein